MSKDKPSKKDKLRKYDLFSIMLEQSSVFRDMVARFQGAFGFRPEPKEPSVVADSVVTASKPRKGVKTNKRAKAAAGAKSRAAKKSPQKIVKARATATPSANAAAAAKKGLAEKAAAPAKKASASRAPKAMTKKVPVKTAKRVALEKASASKK
jgi:hypothetical protein